MHTPELCRNIETEIEACPSFGMLASFCSWLQRHGQHVRRLSLDIDCVDGWPQVVSEQLSQFGAAAPQLQQLEMIIWIWPEPGAEVHIVKVGWAAQLPASLQELSLRLLAQDQTLRLTSSLGRLTQLTKLVLSADALEVAGLPASIRTLALRAPNGLVAHQVRVVQRLRLRCTCAGRAALLGSMCDSRRLHHLSAHVLCCRPSNCAAANPDVHQYVRAGVNAICAQGLGQVVSAHGVPHPPGIILRFLASVPKQADWPAAPGELK